MISPTVEESGLTGPPACVFAAIATLRLSHVPRPQIKYDHSYSIGSSRAPHSRAMCHYGTWRSKKAIVLLFDHHFRDFFHGGQIDALGTGLRAAFIPPGDETLMRDQQLCPF